MSRGHLIEWWLVTECVRWGDERVGCTLGKASVWGVYGEHCMVRMSFDSSTWGQAHSCLHGQLWSWRFGQENNRQRSQSRTKPKSKQKKHSGNGSSRVQPAHQTHHAPQQRSRVVRAAGPTQHPRTGRCSAWRWLPPGPQTLVTHALQLPPQKTAHVQAGQLGGT